MVGEETAAGAGGASSLSLRHAFATVAAAAAAAITHAQLPAPTAPAAPPAPATATEQAKLRRTLVFAWCVLCAGDLPTALPTLLVWGARLPRLPPTLALATLECVHAYLSSAVEEAAAEGLWEGWYGTHGAPPLPTPHARRAEVSYEEHVEDCFDNRANVLEEQVR
jgi:hypothetical protein